jgi:hypothetical protein
MKYFTEEVKKITDHDIIKIYKCGFKLSWKERIIALFCGRLYQDMSIEEYFQVLHKNTKYTVKDFEKLKLTE